MTDNVTELAQQLHTTQIMVTILFNVSVFVSIVLLTGLGWMMGHHRHNPDGTVL